ncbi:hypothetical protein [Variovorax sp.]|uniref:hypothetical protein n=1 Tax=Variovorax sp. TaxID=1871043 RepID=UPI003BAA85E0
MTPEERRRAADALRARLRETVADQPYMLSLLSLLVLYREMALEHPECLHLAAQDCMTVGVELSLRAANSQQPPPGAPIH